MIRKMMSIAVVVTAMLGLASAANATGYVALTYDDGPTTLTQQYVDALGDATATFFVVGDVTNSFYAEGHSGLMYYAPATAYAFAHGQVIGDHTWDHQALVPGTDDNGVIWPGLSAADQKTELQTVKDRLVTMGITPTLWRPPFGFTNSGADAVAGSLSLSKLMWTMDTNDYADSSHPSPSVATTVALVKTAKDQDVILMHDGYPNTLAAIPQILADLKARGLEPGVYDPVTKKVVAATPHDFDKDGTPDTSDQCKTVVGPASNNGCPLPPPPPPTPTPAPVATTAAAPVTPATPEATPPNPEKPWTGTWYYPMRSWAVTSAAAKSTMKALFPSFRNAQVSWFHGLDWSQQRWVLKATWKYKGRWHNRYVSLSRPSYKYGGWYIRVTIKKPK